MIRLLDTNVCIFLIRGKHPNVLSRFAAFSSGDLGVSSITCAELFVGAQKSTNPLQNRLAVEKFLLPFSIALFDYAAAAVYGDIRADLERKGTPLGSLDLLIAAHALALELRSSRTTRANSVVLSVSPSRTGRNRPKPPTKHTRELSYRRT